MRRLTLTPGKLAKIANPTVKISAENNFTIDKQEILDRQRKSVQRLSINPKTSRRQAIQWEAKEQQYKEEITRLKSQKQKLLSTQFLIKDKIQEIQNKESDAKILEYQMYIQDLNKNIDQQREKFLNNYKTLEDKLKKITQDKYQQMVQNAQRYKNALYTSIISTTQTYSCFLKLKSDQIRLEAVEKQFVKLYAVLEPFIEQFQIQSDLESAMLQEQEHKSSVMTFPPNSIFKDTFNKDMFEAEVSTNKSEKSFDQNFIQGNSYQIRRAYASNGDGHLILKQGDEVKLLKKNLNGMWIGENGQSIGYFPESILL